MTTISSLSSAYSYLPTGNATSSVAQGVSTSLSRTAVALANEASITSILGNTTSGTTYDAAGLLNAMQTGSSASSESGITGSEITSADNVQQLLDQLASRATGGLSTATSTYTANGVLQTVPSTDATSNLAAALKKNPALARVIVADTFAQGIVGMFSTSA